MFPFPSPLDFLRAFTLAFLAGSVAGIGVMMLVIAIFDSLRHPFSFWRKA